MGDIIEVTSSLKHRNVSYKVTSSSLVFYLKTSKSGTISLKTKPNGEAHHLIYIYVNNYTWIESKTESGSHHSHRVTIPNFQSNNEKKFWLTWYNGCVRLGVDSELIPITVSEKVEVDNIKYFTVSSDTTDIAYWKFVFPPIIVRPMCRKIYSGKPIWVPATDQLPEKAIIGGYEHEFLYIVRARHRGSLTPGKFVPSFGLAFIPWGGIMHEKSEFDVLCGHDYAWVKTNYNHIPVNAVEAGYSEDDPPDKLYIGRAHIDGHIIPGKVQPSHKVCYIPYNENEIYVDEYEILVQPMSGLRSIDKFNSYVHAIEDDAEYTKSSLRLLPRLIDTL